MPKKEVVTETTETTEIANLPAAEPAIAVAADPVPVSDAVTEVAASSPETTDATETTETTPVTTNDPPPTPALIECVTLHGRLTHEGKTYAPHERVSLPVDLALGLIASGHVAKVE
jgi:hypothetical protein